ncbi:MAG: EAL domain-containing protein [Gammaproteobacteria bacterium]
MKGLTSLTLTDTANLLKSKVSGHAWRGIGIAVGGVLLATLGAAMLDSGSIGFSSLIKVQQSNIGLWVLDTMPFLFGFWGQCSQSVMAFQAGAVIIDRTNDLRDHVNSLEQKEGYDTTHDLLTGLPNRVLFFDRVEQAVAVANRTNEKFAVMVMDLDNFKEVNDTLGHYSGDLLLKQVALRLKSVVRACDTVARLGGDEFGLLLNNVAASDDAEHVAIKLMTELEPQFVIQGLSLDVRASIGICVFPENGATAESLIQRADVAMYSAKRAKCGYTKYSREVDQHSTRRLTLMNELRKGIDNGDLILHFIPKLEITSGAVTEAEALVRWKHEKHGRVMPDEFIPLAEQTGLIRPLTEWVLYRAMQECVAWREQGLTAGVTVNISARAITDPQFCENCATMLTIHELDPSAVVLEITESAIMEDPYHAMKVLVRLGEMGFRLSIDDFGTGYSSLAYLKRLPVDEIKIDKSFVMDMMEDENDAMIVRATIDLAHNLSLAVVAEGVKNQQTWEYLELLGCDMAQGEYTGMPMKPSELIRHCVQANNPRLRAKA